MNKVECRVTVIEESTVVVVRPVEPLLLSCDENFGRHVRLRRMHGGVFGFDVTVDLADLEAACRSCRCAR